MFLNCFDKGEDILKRQLLPCKVAARPIWANSERKFALIKMYCLTLNRNANEKKKQKNFNVLHRSTSLH